MKEKLGRVLKKPFQLGAGAIVVVASAFGIYAPNFDRHDDVAYPEPHADAETYVALGDSYSAGEGLESYVPGTEGKRRSRNRCHQSTLGYPVILGASMAGENAGFRACSGAVIANIFDEEQDHGGKLVGGVQLGGAPDPNTTLVTITVSGNDAGFSKIVSFCARKLECLDRPSFRVERGARKTTIHAFADQRLSDIEKTRLPELYARLKAHFTNPAVRIVVLGYPRLFSRGPDFAEQRFCQKLYTTFSDDERRELRALGSRFNEVIERVATSHGLEYVEVADAFEGHETCGPEGPWLSFLHDGIRELESFYESGGVDPGNFHPTASGQAMMARLVSCYLHYNSDLPTGTDPPNGDEGDVVYRCAAADPAEPPDYDLAGT